ncbi:hypothetical protein BpHYR1_022330 [Brachionus plicatilis]|uniref:Chitin-binding type-2 domain-containing protein n=1 Tax=Brachionus plicatilis TaxID=10195 RepID=A0A3M7T314_BRAPC|nr:hypothetical protein BpHYR1_022330 [Brachionus plicatilis]
MNKKLVALVCLFYLCSFLSVEAASVNITNFGGETKNGVWNYYSYPYHYYNWYYAYPTYTFSVSTCSAVAACPVQCPGTCGLWSGLHACRFTSCAIISTPCSAVNIHARLFLHPFPHDPSRYIQCDTTPGVTYVRSCPVGLVFDARFSVCNYPSQVYYTYASHWLKK